jgi:hypothetical protein
VLVVDRIGNGIRERVRQRFPRVAIPALRRRRFLICGPWRSTGQGRTPWQ